MHGNRSINTFYFILFCFYNEFTRKEEKILKILRMHIHLLSFVQTVFHCFLLLLLLFMYCVLNYLINVCIYIFSLYFYLFRSLSMHFSPSFSLFPSLSLAAFNRMLFFLHIYIHIHRQTYTHRYSHDIFSRSFYFFFFFFITQRMTLQTQTHDLFRN